MDGEGEVTGIDGDFLFLFEGDEVVGRIRTSSDVVGSGLGRERVVEESWICRSSEVSLSSPSSVRSRTAGESLGADERFPLEAVRGRNPEGFLESEVGRRIPLSSESELESSVSGSSSASSPCPGSDMLNIPSLALNLLLGESGSSSSVSSVPGSEPSSSLDSSLLLPTSELVPSTAVV